MDRVISTMANPVKDRIRAELLEITEVLLDDRLSEDDRAALQGAPARAPQHSGPRHLGAGVRNILQDWR